MTGITEKVDALFEQWDRPDSPGCALGVIQDGELVYARGYGMANLEHDVPITSRTVFRIASTSKQFVAMSIALLAEEGKLSLDDDIREYMPEMPVYDHPITVQHLVHHTSGLRDYLTLMGMAGMREHDFYTNDEVVEMIARQKGLNFPPGAEHLYSNTGYYLLGAIVKRASGKSLRAYAEENIFKPLGMAHTHFHDDHTEIVQHRAAGYAPRDDDGYRINMTPLDMVGDGGLFTTVEDLLLWDRNFYGNKLGKGGQELVEQVLTPGVLNNGEQIEYAFGLTVGEYRGLRRVSHGGAFVGFRAEMIRFPEQRFSVICLANLSTFNSTGLAHQVADIYLADAFTAEAAAEDEFIQLSEEELRGFAGVYESATAGMIVEVFVQEGQLMAEAAGLTLQLTPVSATRFRAQDAPLDVTVEFELQEGDQAPLIRVFLGGQEPIAFEPIELVSPPADQLAEYVGVYYSDELQATYRFESDPEEGVLYVLRRGGQKDALKPGQRDVFRLPMATMTFVRDDAGQVVGFALQAGRVRDIRFIREA